MFNIKKLLESIETVIERLFIEEPEIRSRLKELACLAHDRKWEKMLAFPHPRPAIPALLASFLSSIQNANLVREMKQIEEECIDFTANLVGYSKNYGGFIISGGSTGNLCALVTARDFFLGKRVDNGLLTAKKTMAITSTAAHFSIDKAIQIIGIGKNNLVKVPVIPKNNWKPDINYLRKILEKQPIFAVIITFGTTETGTLEPIKEIIELKNEHHFWVHVDAAYGGMALTIPQVRRKAEGIEKADSIVIDPHKLGFIPYPSSIILFRDLEITEKSSSLTQQVPYFANGVSPPVIEGSRPAASATTFWIMMKTLGEEGYAKYIKKLQNITNKFKESLETLKEVQILNEPELPLLIFTINNRKAIIRQFLVELNKKGYHLGYSSNIANTGIEAIRTIFSNPTIKEETIKELTEKITCLIRNLI